MYNETFIIAGDYMILTIFMICLLGMGEGSQRVVLSTRIGEPCTSPSVRVTLRDSRTRNNVPLKAIFVYLQSGPIVYVPRNDMRVNVADLKAATGMMLLPSTKRIVIERSHLQHDFEDGDRLEFIYDFSLPLCTLF